MIFLKGLLGARLSTVQRICLSGLFIAIVTILQKVLAINYIPVVPFLRISLGGPALIIFASIFLGPIYGMMIGIASDVIGYFVFDPKTMGFFPQITAIYGVLGLLSFFIFWLLKLIKNKTVMLIVEGVTFVGLLTFVSLFLFLNDNLQLYSSTYNLLLWQKILIVSVLLVLLSVIFFFTIFFDKKFKEDKLPLSPITVSFACFLIEAIVMVLFGTLMKCLAFGFQTYPMILVCQILVMFINVPLNTWLILLLCRITSRFYKDKSAQV